MMGEKHPDDTAIVGMVIAQTYRLYSMTLITQWLEHN